MEYPRNDELLSAYLDRELSPDERAAMDRLLERSPEARERLRELDVTSRLVRRLPNQGVATDLAEAVIDRLRSESLLRPPPVEPARRSRGLSWRISGPLAAAAMLLIAVWMMYKPDRTSHPPIHPPIDLANAASDRWGQLKVGDFFDLVGPQGESQFQLIVVGKQSDTDPVRCFLIEKTDRAEDSEENRREDKFASRSETGASTLALQANRDQLEALEKAYALASSLAAEPFPIVDISVRADQLVVDDLRALGRFRHSNAQPVVAQQEPSEEARDSSSTAGFGTRRSRYSDRPASAETAAAPETALSQLGNQSDDTRLAQSADGSEGDKELVKNKESQKQFIGRIESVHQRSVKPNSTDEAAPKKSTSEGVRNMVDAGDPRIVLAPAKKDKRQAPGHVEVLLQFKRHSDSDQPDR
jgi:hypothetical protein